MEQAKNFVCRSCSTAVPLGHKFCGRCGAATPAEVVNPRTQYFSQLQVPGRAKLILVRGEGIEGLSYQLNAEQHVIGRSGQIVFPDDTTVSPRHANVFYRNGTLALRDEGSQNGIFLRIRGSAPIAPGEQFMAGDQLFTLEAAPPLEAPAAPDGTYYYASPIHQTSFRVSQLLADGSRGVSICSRNGALAIGREGCEFNFPSDTYMNAQHCRIEEQSGRFVLTDAGSQNGTYVRMQGERDLQHGDYFFIGRKLLRVEVTAA